MNDYLERLNRLKKRVNIPPPTFISQPNPSMLKEPATPKRPQKLLEPMVDRPSYGRNRGGFNPPQIINESEIYAPSVLPTLRSSNQNYQGGGQMNPQVNYQNQLGLGVPQPSQMNSQMNPQVNYQNDSLLQGRRVEFMGKRTD